MLKLGRHARWAVLGMAVVAAGPAMADTWDGGGVTNLWTDPLNWDTNVVPASGAKITFGSSFASGAPDLQGVRNVASLTISTTAAFSVVDGTIVLSSGQLTREDVAGTEANQTLAVDLALGADGAWSIGGSNSLTVNGQISGSFKLTKTGSATLVFAGAKENNYMGLTSINGGALVLNKAPGTTPMFGSAIQGDLAITSSTVQLLQSNQIFDSSGVSVTAGTLDLGSSSDTIDHLTLSLAQVTGAGGSTNGLGLKSLSGDAVTTVGTAASTISANLILSPKGSPAGARSFNIASAAPLTVSGMMSDGSQGPGAIVKNGAGLMTLSGANSYTGATMVNAGTLRVTHSMGMGSNPAVALGGTGQLRLEGNLTFGQGSLVSNVSGGNTALAVSSGTVNWPGAVTWNNSAGVNIASGSVLQVSGPLSGSGKMMVDGGGTLALQAPAAPSRSGGLVIGGGSDVALEADNAWGTGLLELGNGVTVTSTSANRTQSAPIQFANAVTFGGGRVMTFNGSVKTAGATDVTVIAGTTVKLGGSLTGSDALTKSGVGELLLSGDNSGWSGSVKVNTGTLHIQGAHALGSGSADVELTGLFPVLRLDNTSIAGRRLLISSSDAILLGSAGQSSWDGPVEQSGVYTSAEVDAGGTLVLNGPLQGNGTLGLAGAGTLVLNAPAAATRTGSIIAGIGTLVLGNDAAVGPVEGNLLGLYGGGTVMAGSDRNIANHTVLSSASSGEALTIAGPGALNFQGPVEFFVGNFQSPLPIAIQNTTTFGGPIRGTLSATKTGAGVLQLSGDASTWTGALEVNQGTVKLAPSFVPPQSNVAWTLTGTGELQLDGGNGGGLVLPGTGPVITESADINSTPIHVLSGDNTIGGTLTWNGSAFARMEANASLAIHSLAGNGVIAFVGPGTAVLSGPAEASRIGTVAVQDGGTLELRDNGALGPAEGNQLNLGDNAHLIPGGGNRQIANTLNLFNDNAFHFSGNNALVFTGGVNQVSAALQTLDVQNPLLELDGPITGSADLVKMGPGQLTLGGDNSSWSGLLHMQEGAFRINIPQALGNSTQAIQIVNAQLQLGQTMTTSRNIQLYANGSVTTTNGIGEYSGTIVCNADAFPVGVQAAPGATTRLSGPLDGPGELWLSPYGTIELNAPAAATRTGVSAVLAYQGQVTIGADQALGSGLLVLYPGPTIVSPNHHTLGNTVRLGADGTYLLSGNLDVQGPLEAQGQDVTLNVASGGSLIRFAGVSSTRKLSKSGVGQIEFTGPVSLPGGIHVSGGVVAITATNDEATIAPGASVEIDAGAWVRNVGPGDAFSNGVQSMAIHNAAILHVGTGTKRVGVLESAAPAGSLDYAGAVTIMNDTTLIADRVRQHDVFISPGAKLSLRNAASKAEGLSILNGLSMGQGSILDLGNNDLVLNHVGATAIPLLRQWIQGGQIIASDANNASVSPFGRTLAVWDNAQTQFTSFDGLSLPDFQQVLLKYTYFGDANLDGLVSPRDYAIIDGNIGPDRDWGQGDLNGDGKTSPLDYAQIDGNIGAGTGGNGGPRLSILGVAATAVPEPMALPVVCFALVGLLRRRLGRGGL